MKALVVETVLVGVWSFYLLQKRHKVTIDIDSILDVYLFQVALSNSDVLMLSIELIRMAVP